MCQKAGKTGSVYMQPYTGKYTILTKESVSSSYSHFIGFQSEKLAKETKCPHYSFPHQEGCVVNEFIKDGRPMVCILITLTVILSVAKRSLTMEFFWLGVRIPHIYGNKDQQ